jgi:hypothetical protein
MINKELEAADESGGSLEAGAMSRGLKEEACGLRGSNGTPCSKEVLVQGF